ncbi:MAG TPA: polysaccharide biosynthesis/export family protein, partial [Chitinophagaceae bacterium]
NNDLLSISVSSRNTAATEIFNMPGIIGGSELASAYLVNSDGNIVFPLLGTITATGLSKRELQDKLTKTLVDNQLLTDPIVSIRFLNFKITVLGEVNHPTVLTVPSEKISLLEAIGLAGDLTLQARRDNVLIIREENSQKIIKRINLNSTEVFRSPYYYLKSNDVIYVEPNKARLASARANPQWIPYALSGLSIAIGIATLIKF